MMTIRRLAGAALSSLLALALTTPTALAGDNLLWRSASDGSWYGYSVSLGNHGTQVSTQVGSYGAHAQLFSAHDADPPAPIWDEFTPGACILVSQDSANKAGVHAILHQTTEGMTTSATLRRFSDTYPAAELPWTFPFALLGGYAGTAVSDDGGRVVAVAHDALAMQSRVAVFAPGVNEPLIYEALPIFLPVRHFVLSGDGSRLCAVSDSELIVYNLDSSTLEHNEYLYPRLNLNAIALSEDGCVLILGTTGMVEIYEFDGNQYTRTFSYDQPSGSFSNAVAVSRDGSTMACGFWIDSSPTGLHVAAIDLDTQLVISSRDLSAEDGDHFTDISISDDGSRYAVGSGMGAGDNGEELLVFETGVNDPIASHELGGYVNDLEISPDGTVVTVAYSGSNDDSFEGGGIALYEVGTRDISLHGVPRAGATVIFRQRVTDGVGAEMMKAPALDISPQYFPDVGILYLERPAIVKLSPATPTDDPEIWETPYLVGDSDPDFYFQGISYDPEKLSANYIKLSILP